MPGMYDPFKDEEPPAKSDALEDMPIDELISLRARIDALLPVKNLKDLDLSMELVLQVQALQALQQRVLDSTDTPANQVAQCANALSSALANLVRVQSDVYTSERLKRLEVVLLSCLQALPEEAQTEFMDAYEVALNAG